MRSRCMALSQAFVGVREDLDLVFYMDYHHAMSEGLIYLHWMKGKHNELQSQARPEALIHVGDSFL